MKKLFFVTSFLMLSSAAFCEPVAEPIAYDARNTDGMQRGPDSPRGPEGMQRGPDGRHMGPDGPYGRHDGHPGHHGQRGPDGPYGRHDGRGYDESYGRSDGRPGERERLFPHYNKKTEEKIEGEIVDVSSKPSQHNNWNNITIMVRSEKGTFPVVLGPSWFVEDEGGLLRQGEPVKITGSIISEHGKIYMIAKEVKIRDHKIELRDSNGYKIWGGWRKS